MSDYSIANLTLGGSVEIENGDSLLLAYDNETDEILFFDEKLRTRDSSLLEIFDAMRARYRILGK